jgi:hypothetical protein
VTVEEDEVEEFVAVDVELEARLVVVDDVVNIVLVDETPPAAVVDVEEPPVELVDEARDAELVLLVVVLVRPPMLGKTAKATTTMMTIKPMTPATNARLKAARRVPERVREKDLTGLLRSERP